MKVLNCNNTNGNVITESTARIVFYGKLDSITNIYTGARVEEAGKLVGFNIEGISIPKERAKEFYIALWWQFLRENPDILKEILSYDDFNDDIPEGVINSPARVFKILKQGGLNGLGSNCEKFLRWLRDMRNKDNVNSFTKLKREAQNLVNKHFSGMSKEDIIDMARNNGGENLAIITSLVYDKKDETVSEGLYNTQMKKIEKKITGSDNLSNKGDI